LGALRHAHRHDVFAVTFSGDRRFGESLSKEQAEKPREEFFAGADKNCTYEHFNWGDGKIDLKLICKHEQATTTMAMNGTYSPDQYVLNMTSTNNAAGAAGDMTMTMKVDAKRVGDCDSKDKAGG